MSESRGRWFVGNVFSAVQSWHLLSYKYRQEPHSVCLAHVGNKYPSLCCDNALRLWAQLSVSWGRENPRPQSQRQMILDLQSQKPQHLAPLSLAFLSSPLLLLWKLKMRSSKFTKGKATLHERIICIQGKFKFPRIRRFGGWNAVLLGWSTCFPISPSVLSPQMIHNRCVIHLVSLMGKYLRWSAVFEHRKSEMVSLQIAHTVE